MHKQSSSSSWAVSSDSQKTLIRNLRSSQSVLKNNDSLTQKILESANILSKNGALTNHYNSKK